MSEESRSTYHEQPLTPEQVEQQVADLFERIRAIKPEAVIVIYATADKAGCMALGKPVELPQLYQAGGDLLAVQLRRMILAQNAGNG